MSLLSLFLCYNGIIGRLQISGLSIFTVRVYSCAARKRVQGKHRVIIRSGGGGHELIFQKGRRQCSQNRKNSS
nr:MAG TPA: hypothetical protein [Caudoviricetes sp.]